MKYKIRYSVVSDVGKIRRINQDNFICDGKLIDLKNKNQVLNFPLSGVFNPGENSLAGVFDGLGGEDIGEGASYIAAEVARQYTIVGNLMDALRKYCNLTHKYIHDFVKLSNLISSGTTAAILAFTEDNIGICNIGDTKIFRYSDDELEQLSRDHVVYTPVGIKGSLTQNLGAPEDELVIEPYIALTDYRDRDVYLICSDGLTDMVSINTVCSVLRTNDFDKVSQVLLEKALEAGGIDNITVMLLEIKKTNVFSEIF